MAQETPRSARTSSEALKGFAKRAEVAKSNTGRKAQKLSAASSSINKFDRLHHDSTKSLLRKRADAPPGPGDYDCHEMREFDLDRVVPLSSGVSGFGHDTDLKEVDSSRGFLAETRAAKERRVEAEQKRTAVAAFNERKTQMKKVASGITRTSVTSSKESVGVEASKTIIRKRPDPQLSSSMRGPTPKARMIADADGLKQEWSVSSPKGSKLTSLCAAPGVGGDEEFADTFLDGTPSDAAPEAQSVPKYVVGDCGGVEATEQRLSALDARAAARAKVKSRKPATPLVGVVGPPPKEIDEDHAAAIEERKSKYAHSAMAKAKAYSLARAGARRGKRVQEGGSSNIQGTDDGTTARCRPPAGVRRASFASSHGSTLTHEELTEVKKQALIEATERAANEGKDFRDKLNSYFARKGSLTRQAEMSKQWSDKEQVSSGTGEPVLEDAALQSLRTPRKVALPAMTPESRVAVDSLNSTPLKLDDSLVTPVKLTKKFEAVTTPKAPSSIGSASDVDDAE